MWLSVFNSHFRLLGGSVIGTIKYATILWEKEYLSKQNTLRYFLHEGVTNSWALTILRVRQGGQLVRGTPFSQNPPSACSKIDLGYSGIKSSKSDVHFEKRSPAIFSFAHLAYCFVYSRCSVKSLLLTRYIGDTFECINNKFLQIIPWSKATKYLGLYQAFGDSLEMKTLFLFKRSFNYESFIP